jgi:hypothetical protein
MGLYLAVFDDEHELEGVEVGAYADFSTFQDAVVNNLEGRHCRFSIPHAHPTFGLRWPMVAKRSGGFGNGTGSDQQTIPGTAADSADF